MQHPYLLWLALENEEYALSLRLLNGFLVFKVCKSTIKSHRSTVLRTPQRAMASHSSGSEGTRSLRLAHGNATTFGGALEPFNPFGRAKLNPRDMENNCVSVTLTRMLEFNNVHEFWKKHFGKDLEDRPLDEKAIQDMLVRIGWTFEWVKVDPGPVGGERTIKGGEGPP